MDYHILLFLTIAYYKKNIDVSLSAIPTVASHLGRWWKRDRYLSSRSA